MKCLLISSFFPPINGGSAVVYEMLCKHSPESSIMVLAPKRHCATNERLDWEAYDSNSGFKIFRLSLLRPLVIESKSKLQSLLLTLFYDLPQRIKIFAYTSWLIKKNDIDIICIGELNSLSWIGRICKLLYGTKIISYIHGEEVTTETNYIRYGKNRGHYLRNSDAIVAVSKFTKQYLINRFNLQDSDITLIPNGVDLNKFNPGIFPSDLIKRYCLTGKFILITVGRLVPRKGMDNTIKALPIIIKSVPNVHYLIIGIGPYEDRLKQLVNDYNLNDYVTFTGRIDESELVDHYRLCDIFIMANRTMPDGDTEGFGLVFLEANACAKPVIGGKAGGAVEAVKDGYNGLSVDAYKPDEIANAVVSIYSDNKLRTKLITNGLDFSNRSSFHNCASLFNDLCLKISNEKQ
ncbi:MAG: glycosyltransferase family 4 protein [Sedimenticola sp.]|nr:glycosyltransferase family 4 protein [Sedimenticola sp.]